MAELNEKLRTLLVECIREEGLDVGGPVDDPKAVSLIGAIDSADLVSLLVAFEERIDDELEVEVSLMSEDAMSRSRSPFRTLQTLIDFAASLVEANG